MITIIDSEHCYFLEVFISDHIPIQYILVGRGNPGRK